jgi:hypothetical protein
MQWDLFISHASEDKAVFVRPLVNALQNAGLRVWYDEFSLFAGDSLRESIDRGMAESYAGVVVFSHNFFAKNWPRNELNGLFTLSMSENRPLVPIWLHVTAADVSKYSPILADRVALRADQGFPTILSAIQKLLVSAKLKRNNRQVYIYQVHLSAKGSGGDSTGQFYNLISPLPGDWLSKHGYGIPGIAIFGALRKPLDEGGEFEPDNFRENLTFVAFLHDLLAQRIFEDPGLQQEAERQQEGYVYLIDRRTTDPRGNVPWVDTIGWVTVRAGKAIAGSYRRNPEHLLFTADGFFLLTPKLESVLDLELRSKCLEDEARKAEVTLKDQL